MLSELMQLQCRIDRERPLLVGVSGGPDSVCLLDMLRAAGYRLIVAHFNHQLRPEAEEESAAVAHLAETWGLPFVSDSADVHAYAEKEGLSLEEAARLLRYRFLFRAARERSAQAVAVGHTADDQVETVLMHFLRGAGLAGLKGMEARTRLPVFDPEIPLVRPILNLWREETETYCREHNLEPHYDSTNTDQVYFRNRLRHRLLPELETYNPRVKESILRTAAALQGDFDLLEEVLAEKWKESVVETGNGWVAFEAVRMRGYPVALRRNLFRRAAEQLRPENRDIGFEALERAAEFTAAAEPRRIDFINGLYLSKEDGKLYLAKYEADLPIAQWPQVESVCALAVGKIELGNGWSLYMEKLPRATDDRILKTDPWSAWLDAEEIHGELTLRPPRPGERIQPLGMETGSVKLSDLFVNVKLPRRAREKWPILCAGSDAAWVPGVRLGQRFRVTEKTQRVVHLTLKKT